MKERLYAFLLRRLLEPLLDDESLDKLHRSIKVSLQDGTLALTNVRLNVRNLNRRAADQCGDNGHDMRVQLRSATLDRLEIQLSIVDAANTNDATTSTSLTTWRAMRMVNANASAAATSSAVASDANVETQQTPSVRLCCNVSMDGLRIELEPFESTNSSESALQDEPAAAAVEAPPGGYWSRCLDSVMSSLRLSVQLKNASVRFSCPSGDGREVWIECLANLLDYHDLLGQLARSGRGGDNAIFHKALDASQVTISIGESTWEPLADGDDASHKLIAEKTERRIPIALVGDAQLKVLATQVRGDDKTVEIQNDVRLKLSQRMHVTLSVALFRRVHQLLELVAVHRSRQRVGIQEHSIDAPPIHESQKSDDESAMSVIKSFAQQYNEARKMVDQNLFRGGMLLPSDEVDDGDDLSFDAFFDANETGLGHFSSVLMESVELGRNQSKSSRDSLTTTIRIDVPDGNLKFTFVEPIELGQSAHGDENVLLSFSGLSVAASVAKSNTDISMSIICMDAEHSHVEQVHRAVDDILLPTGGGLVVISRLLWFKPGYSDDLVQAPCVSLTATKNALSAVDIELTAETVELTYRSDAVRALVDIFESMSPCLHGHSVAASRSTPEVTNKVKSSRNVSGYAACPSVRISVPLSDDIECAALFRRCGYLDEISRQRHMTFGLEIHGPALEISSADSEPMCGVTMTKIDAFLTAPRTADEEGALRFDVLSLSGRDDLDLTPICLRIWQNDKDQEKNKCSESFPLIPAVSSFKARQEDDDEDNRIDRVLLSDIGGINVATRSDLRGSDPQADMIAAVSHCDYLLHIDVPSCAGDLTIVELGILKRTLDAVFAGHDTGSVAESELEKDPTPADIQSFCVAFHCNLVSLAVHAGSHASKGDDMLLDSVLVNFCKLQINSLHRRVGCRHIRLVADEIDMFDVAKSNWFQRVGKLGISTLSPVRSHSHARRLPDASVEAIIHRSYLFQPISRQSPAAVLDMVNNVNGKRCQQNVYITIYDTTIRYSQDVAFMERLQKIFAGLASLTTSRNEAEPKPSLTRAFLTIADCNIDYASSPRFQTKSRMIIRIGDLRLSSNMVSPQPAKQAFSVALGDAALYLCKERYPYNFENSRIPRAAFYFQPNQVELTSLFGNGDLSPTKVLELMEYVNMGTIDSFDAVVTVARLDLLPAIETSVQASLTVGEICFYACKDSFARLLATLSELSAELTVLNDANVEALKQSSYSGLAETRPPGSLVNTGPQSDTNFMHVYDANMNENHPAREFLLDGYDWTTVDQAESGRHMSDSDEQSTRWYGDHGSDDSASGPKNARAFYTANGSMTSNQRGPLIMTDHFPLGSVSDVPNDPADSKIGKLVDAPVESQIESRICVHDLRLRVRFFDGFDWPDLLDARQRRLGTKGIFLIDDTIELSAEEELEITNDTASRSEATVTDMKEKLMGDLLGEMHHTTPDIFKSSPLPKERGRQVRHEAERRRLSRKSARYFQFVLSGMSFQVDALRKSDDHRLSSFFTVTVQDFFAAETISGDRPVKMAGEWLSDADHPRETASGLFAMKLATWHPVNRVMSNGKLANDECEAVIKLLPLRCILDQRAIRFIKCFVRQDQGSNSDSVAYTAEERRWLPPPLFTSFRFKPLKLKIDYRPEKLDTDALRNGSIVELVNLSPIDSMILTLQQVELSHIIGFGDALSAAASAWIDDICASQLVKFLTNSRPLEPFTSVSQGAGDLIVLPWEAFQNGESVKKALRAGANSLSKAVIYEAFTVTSRATEYIAEQISRLSVSGIGSNTLPSRPLKAPRGVFDTAPHVVESITRGLQAANYKIVVVPYREYRRSGAKGAMTSVMRGIPVAIAAPASGAVEAISYGMIGARNHLAPEVRKEEEANQRGLHWDR